MDNIDHSTIPYYLSIIGLLPKDIYSWWHHWMFSTMIKSGQLNLDKDKENLSSSLLRKPYIKPTKWFCSMNYTVIEPSTTEEYDYKIICNQCQMTKFPPGRIWHKVFFIVETEFPPCQIPKLLKAGSERDPVQHIKRNVAIFMLIQKNFSVNLQPWTWDFGAPLPKKSSQNNEILKDLYLQEDQVMSDSPVLRDAEEVLQMNNFNVLGMTNCLQWWSISSGE